jgi:ParB/RepB/Spo0J family partition protein
MAKISPSPLNYRRTIDKESIKELADNIRQFGLINPITVREKRDKSVLNKNTVKVISIPDEYEIVCGERRYKAYKMLMDDGDVKDDRYRTIPCIIVEMSDEEALDAMMTENMMRKDVDPFEESYGFERMISGGKSISDLSLKFGKSEVFIRGRMQLNKLLPEFRKMVRENKIGLSSAMYISRFDEKVQKSIIKKGLIKEGDSERTIRGSINYCLQRRLNDVIFKEDEKIEGFPVCNICPCNSACQGRLFGEEEEKEHYCSDGGCLDKKILKALLEKIAKEPKGTKYVYFDKDKDLINMLNAAGIKAEDFYLNHRWNYDNMEPNESSYDKGKDDEEYKKDYKAYVKNNEELIASGEGEKVISIKEYRGITWKEIIAVKTGDTADIGSDGENGKCQKDVEIVALESKDEANKAKMNENIIRDLRGKMVEGHDYLQKREKLSPKEEKAFKLAVLYLSGCGIKAIFDLTKKSKGKDVFDVNISEEDFNQICRGFIREVATGGSVTYDEVPQSCLKAVMEDYDKPSYDTCVEKYETVYNKRKLNIDKKIKELEKSKED